MPIENLNKESDDTSSKLFDKIKNQIPLLIENEDYGNFKDKLVRVIYTNRLYKEEELKLVFEFTKKVNLNDSKDEEKINKDLDLIFEEILSELND